MLAEQLDLNLANDLDQLDLLVRAAVREVGHRRAVYHHADASLLAHQLRDRTPNRMICLLAVAAQF